MARRVGGAPEVTSSNGITRIVFEGGYVYEPLPAPERKGKNKGTHEDDATTFGVVYVNDAAREAMLSKAPAKFPVGSVIVREKLSKAEADARPELLAVMVKRAAGFNPKGGDWEFLTVDGGLSKIRERQRKGSCLQCHSTQAERDFVFPLPPSK